MKNLIALVSGALLISPIIFAADGAPTHAKNCLKQATIAAQGLADANPQYGFGKVILEKMSTSKNDVTTYRFLPSGNDGFFQVETTPSTDLSCDVSEIFLHMP